MGKWESSEGNVEAKEVMLCLHAATATATFPSKFVLFCVYMHHDRINRLSSTLNKSQKKIRKQKKKKEKKMPGLTIGDTIPNLELETTQGKIKLHEYVANTNFTIIFSHPGDFSPVCTTELGMMVAYVEKFMERGVKLLGLSADDVESHLRWIKDIEALNKGSKVTFPIAADPHKHIIKQLNMVDPDDQLPSRALHIVGPDNKIKVSFLYPASTGRNMDEVVRVLDSLAMASKHKIATPANWKSGEKVVISPSVSNDEAKYMFPQGFDTVHLPSNKDYLRFTSVD